uniref:Uncharacterized protein n=1 Tax=Plectus sambesii TaxID=2011161 RepID=A0A914WJX8_9BILA
MASMSADGPLASPTPVPSKLVGLLLAVRRFIAWKAEVKEDVPMSAEEEKEMLSSRSVSVATMAVPSVSKQDDRTPLRNRRSSRVSKKSMLMPAITVTQAMDSPSSGACLLPPTTPSSRSSLVSINTSETSSLRSRCSREFRAASHLEIPDIHEQFRRISTFHSFYKAKSRTKRIIWLVVILIGLTLTTHGSYTLTMKYLNDPTISRLTLMNNRSIISLPPATLCIGIRPAHTNAPLDAGDTFHSLLANIKTRQDLLNGNWTRAFIGLAHEYVARVSSWESEMDLPSFRTISNNTSTYASRLKYLESLQIITESLNVSFEDLRNKVGYEIRKNYVDVFILSHSRNTLGKSSFLEQEPNSTWMSENEVCYRVLLNALPIFLQGTFLVIKVGLGTPKLVMDPKLKRQNPAPSYVMLDLYGRPWLGTSSLRPWSFALFDGVIVGRVNMSHVVNLKVSGFYRTLPAVARERRCEDDEQVTQHDCFARCRRAEVKKVCGRERSLLCPHYTHINTTPCFDCLPSCKVWAFELRDTESELPAHEGNDWTRLELRIGSFAYPVFEEQRAWTVYELLGDIGGMCSLWLGVSFLSIIAGASYVVRATMREGYCKILQRRKRASKKSCTDASEHHQRLLQQQQQTVMTYL